MALIAGTLLLIGGATWAVRRGTASRPPTFKTWRLDRGPVEQGVTATGSVNAVVTVQVGSQVSGVIARLGADFNSQVKEGDVIAQIDPTRFRANLAQADAALKAAQATEARARVNARQAKLDLDRAEALTARQVIGSAELDAARTGRDRADAELAAAVAEVARARAAVGMARVDLDRTTIRAPISGVVLQRAVDVGQTVAASLQAPVLFTIAQDLSRMEVRAAIDEADVGKIREGQEATFTVDAYPGELFRATIHQIRAQPNVLQNVVTYDAILRFDNPGGKLRPGMTATVRVVSQRRENVLRVPNAALRFKPPAELVAAGDSQAAGVARLDRERHVTAQAPSAARPQDAAERPNPPRGEGRGPGGRGRTRVYRPVGEKLSAVTFRPGINDDEFTEVAEGPLSAGDEVVVDVIGGLARSPATGGGRRGPRFF